MTSMNNDQSKKREKTSTDTKADEVCTNKFPNRKIRTTKMTNTRKAEQNNTELDMLRQHKPPPIRRIRISDFGLSDPKRDPDRHQNCITWSLSHALPLQKISSKSVHKFPSNPTDRQTNRQTNRPN